MKNLLSIIAASLLAFPVLALPANSGTGNMKNNEDSLKPKMVKIPGKSYEMMTTEVTQGLYKSIMGENPSFFRKDNNELDREKKAKLPENTDSYPVEQVTWYSAICFCNKLSEKFGLELVYSVFGITDVTKWPLYGEKKIVRNISANGYRLPTNEEWEYAARGGQYYKYEYAGSNNLDEVGWFDDNSGYMTHPVAQKKPNEYGLYDMSGNVWELCGVLIDSCVICLRGGSWRGRSDYCKVYDSIHADSRSWFRDTGFRLARTIYYKAEPKIIAKIKAEIEKNMVKIPGKNYEMMNTEVTQGLYKSIMGENPSWFRKDNNDLFEDEKEIIAKLPENTDSYPVENVSWYDAIYFCNNLSQGAGLEPVYSVNGSTDVTKWGYTPHNGKSISGITQNTSANGYRLPTVEEWEYAARGGKKYKYSGNNNLDKVGWFDDNSGEMTQPVAQKSPNGYGLYDMSGNVWERCWDMYKSYSETRCSCGGSWDSHSNSCEVGIRFYDNASNRNRYDYFGFRLARTAE